MTTSARSMAVGGVRPLDGSGATRAFELPTEHLLTHGCIVGMTGSGKTGLLMVAIEEALRSAIPVIIIDIKGDLPNLLLTFPNLAAHEFEPWIDEEIARSGSTRRERAEAVAADWQARLADWQLGAADVSALRNAIAPRVFTPGMIAGEPLHVLSSLEQPSPFWTTDVAAARESLSASISLLLRLIGRDPDPTRSRDHVVLSVLAERRLRSGSAADVGALLEDVRTPPIERLGAMHIDEFLPKRDRLSLATALNTLLASPTFESWRTGAPIDIAEWVAPRADGRTPATIVSVAHLDDDERALVLGIVLDQLLAWVRTLTGTQQLRAMLVFDEVYGFMPPHPANPPTKRPLVALMKQARVRLGRAGRDAKSDGSGLSGVVQCGCVVRGAVADRCRPRARGRGAQRRSRFRRGRRELGERAQALGTTLVRLAQRTSAAAAGIVAVPHHAVLVEGANDTRRFEAAGRHNGAVDDSLGCR